MVSDVKTVGSLPFERWESTQSEFPTKPLESEVEKSYSCLDWYAISRVGSHLLKSKKDDANMGQEKKREALRDRVREKGLLVLVLILVLILILILFLILCHPGRIVVRPELVLIKLAEVVTARLF